MFRSILRGLLILTVAVTLSAVSASTAYAGDLSCQGFNIPTHTVKAGDNAKVYYAIRNLGSTNSGWFRNNVVLSADTTLDASDAVLKSFQDVVTAGNTEYGNMDIRVPAGTAAGTWYLGLMLDVDNNYPETNETNNATGVDVIQIPGAGTTAGPTVLQTVAKVDLLVTAVSASSAAKVGGMLFVDSVFQNAGPDDAGAFVVRYYLSSNNNVNTRDVLLGAATISSIPSGRTAMLTKALTIPATVNNGTYYLGVVADPDNTVVETDENNNMLAAANQITVSGAQAAAAAAPATPAVPVVRNLNPNLVYTAASTPIVIEGQGFTGATRVSLATGSAVVFLKDVKVISDTVISATMPSVTATGSFHVQVSTPAGTNATSMVALRIEAAPVATPVVATPPGTGSATPTPATTNPNAVAPKAGGRLTATVQGMTIEADRSVTVNARTTRYEGNVTINGSLKIKDAVEVDSVDGSIKLVGGASVYAQPLRKEVTIWDGGDYWMENGNLINRRLRKNPAEFTVGGLKVKLSKMKPLRDGVELGGYLQLPKDFGKNFSALEGLKLTVKKLTITQGDGVKFHGRLTFMVIPLAGGFRLRDTYLEYNQFDNIWEGGTTLMLPKSFGIMAALAIKDGHLQKVGFGVNYLNLPILQAPPVFLDKVYGEIDNLSPTAKLPIRLRAIIGLRAGPQVQWGSRNYYLVYAKGTASIDVTGRLAGKLELTIWNEDFRALDALLIVDPTYGVYGEMDVEFLKIFDAEARMRYDFGNKLQGSLMGVLSIPRTVPWVGGIELGRAAAWASNEGIVAGVRALWITYAVEINPTGAIKVGRDLSAIQKFVVVPPADKTVQLIETLQNLYGGMPVALETPLKDGERMAYTLDRSAPYQIARVTWAKAGTDADVALVGPDGARYTYETAESNPAQVIYRKNPELNEAWIAVRTPAQGPWEVQVSESAKTIGRYEVEIVTPNTQPTAQLNVQDLRNGSYQVSWSSQDAENDAARVSLYYDTDDSHEDGFFIAENLPASGTYTWTPANVQSGQYHLYAKVEDGKSLPTFAYTAEPVEVNHPSAPAVPTNVVVAAGDAECYVTWTEVADADILGYRVYFTDDAASGYREVSSVGVQSFAWLTELKSGRPYRVAVAAVDQDGNQSQLSNEIVVVPTSTGNNPPYFVTHAGQYARAGVDYEAQVMARDSDRDTLSYRIEDAPEGLFIDGRDGRITWTPAAAQRGNHRMTVIAEDGRGGEARMEVRIHVATTREPNAAPEVVRRIRPSVAVGESYGEHVLSHDAEAEQVSLRLAEAPAGMTLDGAGDLAWTPTAAQAGSHRIAIEATDASGNTRRETFTVVAMSPELLKALSAATVGPQAWVSTEPSNTVPPVGAKTTSRKFFDRCFIATASLESGSSQDAAELVVNETGIYSLSADRLEDLHVLRRLRDRLLLTSAGGRAFVDVYYTYGPSAATQIRGSDTAKALVRGMLIQPLVAGSRLALGEGIESKDLAGWSVIGLGLGLLILVARRKKA